MKTLSIPLLLMFSLLFISQTTAQTLHPENWSPTWVNPSWERPENMTPDTQVSLPGDLSNDQLSKPSTCGGCHSDIYSQWKGSVHANAFKDPIFQKATKLFLSQSQTEGQLEEARSCVRCHIPLGHLSKEIETTDVEYSSVTLDTRSGIFCDFCHSVKACAGIGNGSFIVDTGLGADDKRVKWGPRDDALTPDFHNTTYSELHTKSEICGMCHDVTHTMNGLPLERTYTEWREGPYNTGDPQTTVYCQDCHMRQLPGKPATGSTERPDNPGTSAFGGKQRDHVYTHYHIGGNAALPTLFEEEEHAEMAAERLQNCATVEIIPPDELMILRSATFQVKVSNTGAGHYIPTGLSEIRQVWLEVVVKDTFGRTLFESGSVDDNGNIDSESRMFHIELGDKDGNPTANVAMAEHIISDHRIPPKGHVVENYSFFVPLRGTLGYTIEAKLRYRSASQSLIDSLLGEETITLPIIDMASATTEETP